MTNTGELWVFAGLIVLGQFSPGPDMVLLTRTALRDGSKAGVEMAIGIACGLAVHSTIAVGGVAVAFQRFPMLRLVLQWVAAFYLLWLAYGLLRVCFVSWYSGVVQVVEKENSASAVCSWIAVQFVQPEGGVVSRRGVCAVSSRKSSGLVAVCDLGRDRGLGIGLWSLWVLLLQWRPLRVRYERAGGWIDGIFGLALVALAIRLMIG